MRRAFQLNIDTALILGKLIYITMLTPGCPVHHLHTTAVAGEGVETRKHVGSSLHQKVGCDVVRDSYQSFSVISVAVWKNQLYRALSSIAGHTPYVSIFHALSFVHYLIKQLKG